MTIGIAGTGGLASATGTVGIACGNTTFIGTGQDFIAFGGLPGSPTPTSSNSVTGGRGGDGKINIGGDGGFVSKGQDGTFAQFNTSPGDGGDATSGGSGGRGFSSTVAPGVGSLPGGGGGGGNLGFDGISTQTAGANGAQGLVVITYPSPLATT